MQGAKVATIYDHALKHSQQEHENETVHQKEEDLRTAVVETEEMTDVVVEQVEIEEAVAAVVVEQLVGEEDN